MVFVIKGNFKQDFIKKFHQIYIDGNVSHRMEQKDFINHVINLVEEYAERLRK